jgi:signal transduction histidine kinase
VSDAAAPRFDSEGEFLGYIGSVIDITERRQAEEVRERLLSSEREARHEAEEANQAKANFLATMSHELRTPLNAIIGFADLLDAGVAGPLTNGQRAQLERIDAGARHLLRIIEEILTFSRIEAGREEIHVEHVDLAEVVRETARLIEPLVRSKGLRFSVRAPDQSIEADTDAGKVRQILLNLMSNAAKFTESGEVKVGLSAREGGATIVIDDTGIGIPPDQIARIFEPFRQVAQGHAHRAEGTGLGLSVSRHLARLLGGDVSAESTPGEGSTFTFTLPLSPPPRQPSD